MNGGWKKSMGFKSVENNGGLMKEGDYEVYVKECGYSQTKNGNECIKFEFVVRADVEQEYKNKHIFKNFYPSRETGGYDADKIGKYANALGIEKGQDFELEDLIGRNCILHISHFTGDDGVTRECIFWTAQSKANSYITDVRTSDSFGQVDDISDDELPF